MSKQESFASPVSTVVVVLGDALRPFESGLRADGFTLVSPTDPVRPAVAFVSLDHPDACNWCARLQKVTTVLAVATDTTDEDEIRRALEAGAEDVIPLSETVLRHRLRRVAAALPSAGRETRFLEFFHKNPLPCAMFDYEKRQFAEVNDAMVASIGFSREELIGRSVDEVGNFSDPTTLAAMRARLAANDRPLTIETDFRVKSGGIRRGVVALDFVFIEGRPYVVAISFDVTDMRAAELARAETERRLVELTRMVPGIVCEYRIDPDASERFTFINAAARDILGMPPEALLADPQVAWKLVHPDEAASVRQAFVDAHYKLQSVQREFRVVLPDGTVRWLLVNGAPRREGRTTYWSGIFSDVTEARRLARELDESRRKLEEITEAMPGAVYRYKLNPDGSDAFLFFTRGLDDIFGVPAASILEDAGNAWRLVHPDDLERVNASSADSAARLTPWECEYRILPPGGEKWVQGRSRPHRDSDGSTVWDGFFTDITERKRIEAERNAAQQKLAEITAGMPGAVFQYRYAPDGRESVPFVSDGVEPLFGVSSAEIMADSANIWRYCHPDDKVEGHRLTQCSQADLIPFDFTYRLIFPDGTRKWVRAQSVPIRQADGSTIWSGLVTDVTEQKLTELAREEAERKLSEIAAAMPGAVYQYLKTPGGHYRFAFVSEGAAALFGISSPVVIEEVNRVFNEGLTRERWEEAFRLIEESAATMTPYRQEFSVNLPDGGSRWLRAESVPRRLENGGVLWSGMMLDISERKQAEAARAAAEARLREVADAVPGAVYQYARHPDGREAFEFMSAGGERIYGVSPEAVKADPNRLFEVIHPDDAPRTLAETLRAERELNGFDMEYRVRHDRRPDEWKWIRVQAVTNRREDGATVWTGLVTDISDYKFLESSLRASEERFAMIFRSSPIACVVTRLKDESRIVAINEAFTRLYGFTEEQALGRTSLELGMTIDVHKREAMREAVLAGLTPSIAEGPMRTATGEFRELFYLAERIIYDGDVCALTMIVDLTDRVRLEDERLRVSKLESLGVMAGGIAHDFNNLLTAMSGNAGLARRYLTTGAPTAKIEDKIESLERAVERAKTLSTQLLTFAKGGDPVRRTVEPILFVVDPVRFVLNPTNVTGRFNAPSGLWQVKADVGQLSQVFQNLAINAVEAMNGKGVLEVSIENLRVDASYRLPLDSGRYVRVTISDTGCGIPPDRLAKIFDPYYTTKPSGSGLGLAVAHSVVIKHGGYIAVRSEVGKGSRFEIYLPARETGALTYEVPVLTADDELRLSGRRILVMDDEELVRDMTAAMLEDLGYHPSTCSNGEAAVARYTAALGDNRPFAAVILDLKVMGGMGGLETIRHLKQIDPGVVAIVCSGYFSDPVLAHHESHGFTAKLQKPFKMEELRDLLAGLFGDG
jgi:PAS domain S-box-containing protein